MNVLRPEDLDAAVELVYAAAARHGFDPALDANHHLMGLIKELDLGAGADRECWVGSWGKYRSRLLDLGYSPGW